MRHSKKGMSALFKIVIVIITISLFGGVILNLVNKGKQSALDILGYGNEPENGIGARLEGFISIASAESGTGKPLEVLTAGATTEGTLESFECGGVAGCPLSLVFDRKIQSFSNDHFTVMQKEGWASGWRQSESITVRSLNNNRVILTGFERGVQYFVRLNTLMDYEEAGTGQKFKLNSATAALRFQTS